MVARMKIYKESKKSDKKEMFFRMDEDEDGEINIRVCDAYGNDDVLLLWVSKNGALNAMSCAREELQDYGYDTKEMQFNEDGQVVIE